MINKTNDLQKILELTEFQKKKIKKNLSYDFNLELDKITDNKEFFFKVFLKKIEMLSEIFDSQGIMFYGINLEIIDHNNNFEAIYEEVEELLNYIGYNIELVEFCYFSIEIKNRCPIWQNQGNNEYEKEKKIFLINGIVTVRSILGNNSFLFTQIKELFLLSFYDIKVTWLQNYSAITEYWFKLINQKNFKFHRFVNYSNFYDEIYGSIADEELKFDDRCAFGQENHFISDTMNLSGIKKKFPSKSEIILYLLYLFMDLYQLRLYKNKIYSKVINSKISWYITSNLDEIKKRFVLNFNQLQLNYPQQLKYFNIKDLILTDLDFVFDQIKKNNVLLHEEVFFNDIIEFRDGIFFFEDKKFLEFHFIDNLYNLRTNIYIDCIYSDANSNIFWLVFLKKKLSQSEFEFFFQDFK